MASINKSVAARRWLTKHGHLLNLRALARECGVSKDVLSRHCLGKVTLTDDNAILVAQKLEEMGVKLFAKNKNEGSFYGGLTHHEIIVSYKKLAEKLAS